MSVTSRSIAPEDVDNGSNSHGSSPVVTIAPLPERRTTTAQLAETMAEVRERLSALEVRVEANGNLYATHHTAVMEAIQALKEDMKGDIGSLREDMRTELAGGRGSLNTIIRYLGITLICAMAIVAGAAGIKLYVDYRKGEVHTEVATPPAPAPAPAPVSPEPVVPTEPQP